MKKKTVKRKSVASPVRRVRKSAKKGVRSPNLVFWLALFAVIFVGLFLYRSNRVTDFSQEVSINQIGVSNGAVELSFSPASVTLEPDTDQTFNLNISVSSGYRATIAQVEIAYDPAKVGVPVLTQGDYFTDKIGVPRVENGKINFTYTIPLPEPGQLVGKSGSGLLATIKIRPPAAGVSALSFTENTIAAVVDDAGNDISTNMLKSVTDATITVASAQTVSPVSSPSQAASPVASPSQAASPVASPSQAASPAAAAPSRTTTLRTGSVTCSSLAFSWDTIFGASGYVIDLADNSSFNNKISSGSLGSDRNSFSFSGLRASTAYYVRVSQTGIHDFPRYTQLGPITTSACTVVQSGTSTPKPTVKASPTPTPRASLLSPSPFSVPQLSPVAYTDNRFSDAQPPATADSRDASQDSLFTRFIAWLVSLFD